MKTKRTKVGEYVLALYFACADLHWLIYREMKRSFRVKPKERLFVICLLITFVCSCAYLIFK